MGFSQSKSDLHVTLNGLHNNDGELSIYIHQGPEGFPDKNMYRVVKIKSFTAPVAKFVIPNILYGSTAISVLHDENSSGKMDFNFVHYPTESFGFYKNYKVSLRRPDYEEVAFDVNQPKMEIEIKMQN